MNYKLLKIYKFEDGNETTLVAIYENKRSLIWHYSRFNEFSLLARNNDDDNIKFIQKYTTDYGAIPITLEKAYNRTLVLECLSDLHEDKVIWRTDSGEQEKTQLFNITKDYSLDRFYD